MNIPAVLCSLAVQCPGLHASFPVWHGLASHGCRASVLLMSQAPKVRWSHQVVSLAARAGTLLEALPCATPYRGRPPMG
eukprot:679660-Karenia_brevis.AAC.1